MEFEKVNRIGIFKFKHIGDVLLMTPALRLLKQHFPHAKLSAIVHSFAAPLLQNNPDLDEVIEYDRSIKKQNWFRKIGNEWRFAQQIRKTHFDMTIDFGTSERAIWCAWSSGVRYRTGILYHRWEKGCWQRRCMTHLYPPSRLNTFNMETHQVLKDISLIRQIQAGTPDLAQPNKIYLRPEDTMEEHPLCLNIAPKDAAWAEVFLRAERPDRIIVVHPVSRWMSKCWEDRRMAQVIDWLQQKKDCRVLVTSSSEPQELAHTQQVVALCQSRPLLIPGTLSLGQMAALCRAADIFLGIDTAPMHMAAAVGTKVVALFGPTKPKNWGPWTPHAITLYHPLPETDPRVLQHRKGTLHPSMAQLTPEQVQTALETMLS